MGNDGEEIFVCEECQKSLPYTSLSPDEDEFVCMDCYADKAEFYAEQSRDADVDRAREEAE